jgi:hypothetical protein
LPLYTALPAGTGFDTQASVERRREALDRLEEMLRLM